MKQQNMLLNGREIFIVLNYTTQDVAVDKLKLTTVCQGKTQVVRNYLKVPRVKFITGRVTRDTWVTGQ